MTHDPFETATVQVNLMHADPGGDIMSCEVFDAAGQSTGEAHIRLSSGKNNASAALTLAAAILRATTSPQDGRMQHCAEVLAKRATAL